MDNNDCIGNVVLKCLAFEGSAEQSVESDITLPEYFPDIVKVLKCTVLPNIASVSASGDRITAEGNAVLSVLYLSDDGKMHCFEQKIPYSKYIECKNTDGCAVTADAKTEYVNCRVVSQRRLDIHASVSISFKAYKKSNQCVVRSCQNDTVQLKKDTLSSSNLRDCCEKCFNVSETLEIGAALGSIGQIVRSEAVAVLGETKLVTGKILIKGELKIKTLYLSENDNELQKIENTLPISQIVEADTGEDSIDVINLSVSSLEVFAKTDSSGALRLIDLTAVIRADISIYENVEIDCVTDSYSTAFETQQKLSNAEVRNIAEKFYDTYLCRGSLDMSGTNVASVIDMSCTGINANTKINDNELLISGTVGISMLVCDNDAQIIALEREFDFEYKRTVSVCCQRTECLPKFTVTGINFLLGAENKIDVRVEMDINAVIFSIDTKRVVSELTVDENSLRQSKSAALTIYFAEEGESVWDIARRYNTTVSAIKTENKLTTDALSEKCKLLIPTA